MSTTEFVDDGNGPVRALRGHEVRWSPEDGRPSSSRSPAAEFELPGELVLLALGFLGAERARRGRRARDRARPTRGTVAADGSWSTNLDGVFVCGDMTRGQSLIVWAIAEGRSAAASVDRWLMGDTRPAGPARPGQLALR